MRSIGSVFLLGVGWHSKADCHAVVASRESDTVVLRVCCAWLRSRGFCPIGKSTILWDATQPECILLQAGGVNEISVCATGEKQSGKRQPCKGN